MPPMGVASLKRKEQKAEGEQNMDIKELKLADIRPYEKNPRKNDGAVEYVANSIKEFGFKVPIVIDKAGIIVAGHTRYKAAKKLGLKTAPCIIADDLTEDQIKAFRLADNKVAEKAEWDLDLLDEELVDLVDFDMEQFGFDLTVEEMEETEVKEDDYEEPDDLEERVKKGDIWQLGEHRLMCGDSTSITDVEKLMGGEIADLVFTDPPYGMKKESDGVANDNLNYDDLLDFNREWIPVSFHFLKDTGCWYCWGIDEPLMDIYSNILRPLKQQNKLVIRNFITWAKHSAFGINWDGGLSYPRETEKAWFVMKGMDWNNNNSEFFNTKFERILEYMQAEANAVNLTPKDLQKVCGVSMYSHWFSKSQFAIISEKHYQELQAAYAGHFKKPYKELREMLGDSNDSTAALKPYFDNVAKDNFGDIGLTDVWRIPTTGATERETAGGHATPKPIALCCRAIYASSREGEKVLDLFGGSGSTMIACEDIKRKAYLMELEPHWCDVIIDRWEKHTGKQAVLLNED